MRRAACFALALVLAGLAAAEGPKGTVPRSAASRYPAHATRDGVAVGAALLVPEQVKRAFASDLNRCCVVVEVAVYPEQGKPLDVTLDDFTLRIAGTEVAAKPSSARLLAATLQKAPAEREVTISPHVGIGYESGPRVYDPVTGERRGGGVRTSAGVGVGVGESRPASTDRDCDTMELELSEKGLPEGMAAAAVAGYLYFNFPSKRKNAAYHLEYTLRGSKLSLRLL